MVHRLLNLHQVCFQLVILLQFFNDVRWELLLLEPLFARHFRLGLEQVLNSELQLDLVRVDAAVLERFANRLSSLRIRQEPELAGLRQQLVRGS